MRNSDQLSSYRRIEVDLATVLFSDSDCVLLRAACTLLILTDRLWRLLLKFNSLDSMTRLFEGLRHDFCRPL